MRDTFVRTLVECAKKDKNIELVTGDLGFGVLKPFWEQCPDQFTNAGIAEQNMTGVAAGMALTGKNVFTYSIGNFYKNIDLVRFFVSLVLFLQFFVVFAILFLAFLVILLNF